MKINKNLIKNIFKGLLCIFLFFESVWIQRLLIIIFNIKKVTTSTATLLNFCSNIIFCLFLIFLFRKELIKEWKIYKKNLSDNVDIGIKYWLLGLAGMMAANIIINFILGANQASNEQSVQKMIAAFPILMIINAGIIAPINEEILFRKCFKNVFKKKWLFILSSGIFFGFLHVSSAIASFIYTPTFELFKQSLYIIPYSCLGISFAYMYYKTDSVYTSIFMHMFHNTALTIVSILL